MSIAEKFEVIADEVYDKGVSDENLEVTNKITVNNTRFHYHLGFQYSNWSGYKFAFPIKPTGYIGQMFYSCSEMTELPTPLDFSAIFTAEGYTEDTVTYRKGVFAHCLKLECVPDLNMRVLGGLEDWFTRCWKLHTIEMLRVNENTIYNNTFNACSELQNIAFDGVIGQNISFVDCLLLTDASLENIAQHLKDFLPEWKEGDGNKAIITLHATVKERIKNTEIENLIKSKKWGIA